MKYSKLGYKRYSPDLYKKYNIIPSGRITMKDVDFPVYGVDDMGNAQMMYPGREYQFPGNQVFELPMAQAGTEVIGIPAVDVYADARQKEPYWDALTAEQKRYWNDKGPIGRSVRRRARVGDKSLYSDLEDIARRVQHTGAELTGLPGTVRFFQDPVSNLKGAGHVVEDFMLGTNPMASSFLNTESTPEEMQQFWNTVDAATLVAAAGPKAAKTSFNVGKHALREGVDLVHPVGRQLRAINRAGTRQGLTPAQIRDWQMTQVGITSDQRKGYFPGLSEVLTEYYRPYGYDNFGKNILDIPRKILKGEKNSNPNYLIRPHELDHNFNAHTLINDPHLITTSRYDAWRIYSGLPQKHDTFRVAKTTPINHPSYKPGQLDNLEKFSINSERRLLNDKNLPSAEDLKDLEFGYNINPKQLAEDAPYLRDEANRMRLAKAVGDQAVDWNHTNIMGGYNRRYFKDPAGKSVMEYNDIWDLHPGGFPIENYYGKPFLSHGQIEYSFDPAISTLENLIKQAENAQIRIRKPDFKELFDYKVGRIPTSFDKGYQVGGESDPEMMFRDKYNTELTASEKKEFDKWVAEESKRQGRDILMDMGAYDLQGFWKSGDYKRMDQDNHGSDTWKKPNHPTFSNQSRYHNTDGWYGGNWTEDGGYQPSKQTLQMYDPGYYEWMFGTEPNRPEHLDMSRYESGVNAPTPMYYEAGGDLEKYGKGGLTQWFAEKWVDVKTGKECGRSGKDKNGRPYPACRPSKRVNETTPKTASEMSSSEKAKFKREKTSGKRINYNHERKQQGGQMSGSLGYDSMYGSPTTAFRYMMNPQDDSKYYGEVYGTKQGPGIAVGLDYDNQKYGTQGMIRLGADPLRGGNIRAQGGKKFNPIDNRREKLSWGPYGGIGYQMNDYTAFTGTGDELGINNLKAALNYGVNAQYNRELANRGRFSVEGDLGLGIHNKGFTMGKFEPEPYAAIKATYSPPMYRNTRNKRPSPTTYRSGYQLGGGIPQAQMGLFFNPFVQSAAELGYNAGQAIRDWFSGESSDVPVQQTQTQAPQKQSAQPTGFSDNEFLYRQAYQESRFDPNAKSPAGYSGLTQLGEGIITDYQKATGDTRSNPFDPDFAISVQKWAMDKYLNSTPWIRGTDEVKRAKALASYNWGPGNTKKALEKLKADGVDIYNNLDWISGLPTETQLYINHIMGLDYSDEPQWEESYTTAKKKSPYGNYYRQVGGEKKENKFDESIRDRIVDRVNEIVAREDFYHLPPGLAEVVRKQGHEPDNETCIGGVCRVYRDTGVMEEIIPKNTEFARRAPELGFTRGFKLGALKPGDMLQHMANINDQGNPYPSHSQLFVGMDDDGNYRFYDNWEATNTWGDSADGKQDGIRTYTPKQIKKFLKLGAAGKVHGASIYHLDPNAANYLTEDEAKLKAIRDANRRRRLPLETELDANYTGDAYYQEVSETKDIPYYYGSGRSQDDRETYPIATKNEDKLLRLFNSQEMDQKLIDMFNITDQSLNRLKPLIYGIMWQESNFGEPKSIGASIKYAGESLLGTSNQSTGIPSVKYSQLRDFVKKELDGRGSLNSAEGAYIAALDMLLQSGNYSDSYVSADKNPELLDKDPWVPALYFYNGQGRGLSRGRASDNTPLRADKGSYPDKVMRYADKLKVGIPFDADLGNLDVYRNPYEVIVTPERQQRYGGGIPRYSGKLYR